MKVLFYYGRPLQCAHGPQVWPWWRLVTPSFISLHVHPPSSGYRLWLYTRWGSPCFDIYFNRRDKVTEQGQ